MGKHHKKHSSSSKSKKKHKHKHVKEEAIKKEENIEIVKEKPCFEASGILAQYAQNALGNGKVLKFTIPFDAKEPTANWQLFPFKKEQSFASIQLKGKSAFLVGKDVEIVDVFIDNPTISKQHCVIQFREIRKVNNKGEVLVYIKPYIMDLESTNGTYLNDQKLESARYYELIEEDVLRFGISEREYVLIKS